jgi:hypothetical protein
MTDIVERLRSYASDDHERLCQGREYSCTCGYDEKRDPLLAEAAAEIERLRAHLKTAIWSDSEECKLLTADNERLRKMLWEVNEQCPEHVPTSLLTQIRAALAEEKAHDR